MKVLCKTLFDCAATRVTGHFKSSLMPFHDGCGHLIETVQDWNRSRNRQRNWETLLQIIGLRCQPMDIVEPAKLGPAWQFEFTVESEGAYGGESFSALYKDCEGVPMVIELDECHGVVPHISVAGDTQNIWFAIINT